MPGYYGDTLEDTTITIPWNTNGADGASITRAVNGTFRVYKDNGTTEITAGVTDGEDHDGKTGAHMVTIDTSADAAYGVGSRYHVLCDAMTIDGKTVNHWVGSFSIELHKPKVNVVQVDGAALGTHGSGYFPSDVRQNAGSAITASSGRQEVNASHWGGTAIASAQVRANVVEITGEAVDPSHSEGMFPADVWRIANQPITEQAGANFALYFDNDDAPTTTYLDQIRSVNVTRWNSEDVANLVSGAVQVYVSAFAAGAIDAAAIAAAAANKIADHVRRRTQANVEASSDGDSLDKSSLYGLIQQAQDSNSYENAGELTIYKTDGTTELGRLDLETDAAAEPITGTS